MSGTDILKRDYESYQSKQRKAYAENNLRLGETTTKYENSIRRFKLLPPSEKNIHGDKSD